MENVFRQRKFKNFWSILLISCIIFSACKNIHSEKNASDGYLLHEMQNAVDNCDTMLILKEPILSKDIYDAYIYLYQYDPYVIGLSKKLSIKPLQNDEYVERVSFDYLYSADEINEKKEEMNKFINKITSEFPSTKKKEYLAQYIYDTLLLDFEYCDNEKDSNTAYSALVLKKGNCQSLSKAFVLLCDKAGIDAGYVVGTLNKMPHMWNFITIDGIEYQCDLTKGIETPQSYFLKGSFDDDRVYNQQIVYLAD